MLACLGPHRRFGVLLGSFWGPAEGPEEGSSVPRSPAFAAVSTLRWTAWDAWLSMIRKGSPVRVRKRAWPSEQAGRASSAIGGNAAGTGCGAGASPRALPGGTRTSCAAGKSAGWGEILCSSGRSHPAQTTRHGHGQLAIRRHGQRHARSLSTVSAPSVVAAYLLCNTTSHSPCPPSFLLTRLSTSAGARGVDRSRVSGVLRARPARGRPDRSGDPRPGRAARRSGHVEGGARAADRSQRVEHPPALHRESRQSGTAARRRDRRRAGGRGSRGAQDGRCEPGGVSEPTRSGAGGRVERPAAPYARPGGSAP